MTDSIPTGAAAAGTIRLGDFTVNRMGFGAMRLAQQGRPFVLRPAGLGEEPFDLAPVGAERAVEDLCQPHVAQIRHQERDRRLIAAACGAIFSSQRRAKTSRIAFWSSVSVSAIECASRIR